MKDKKMSNHKKFSAVSIRNTTFGVQDSLGSTLGFLSGITVGGAEAKTILFAGTVLIIVEAVSMGIGSVLSEHTVEEYEKDEEIPMLKSASGGIIMFLAYLLTGLIPLAPFILLDPKQALGVSIILSFVMLAIFAWRNSKTYGIDPKHYVSEAVLVGGVALMAGILVGLLFPY